MCYCFCFFFYETSFAENPLRCRTRETYASTDRGGHGRSPGGCGGRTVCKAQEQFSELTKGERKNTADFSEEVRFSPPVYLSLLAPDVALDACFFHPARPRVAPQPFVYLLHCAVGK